VQNVNAESTSVKDLIKKRAFRKFRVGVPELKVEERHGFDEIIKTLSKDAAKEETDRCLKCDLMCSTCVSVCPNKAMFAYNSEPIELALPILKVENREFVVDGEELFSIAQKIQTAVYSGFCNECGNCAIFCPTAGKPYKDKPRIYNNVKDFNDQTDNAFMICKAEGKWQLKAKFNDELHVLDVDTENIYYSTPEVKIELTVDLSQITNVETSEKITEDISLKQCAMMYALLTSIIKSNPEMPVNRI
jgi:putative selenate reductase